MIAVAGNVQECYDSSQIDHLESIMHDRSEDC